MFIILGRKTVAAVLSAAVLVTAVAVSAGGIYHNASVAASAGADWGLSFGTEGQPPSGNATKQHLAEFNAHYLGDTSNKRIYLTFDAGYENGFTPKILDTLKKHNAKATFFLVGNYIKTSPDLVKRMINEGHTVGNHTFSHPDMSAISDKAAFTEELTKLLEMMMSQVGSDKQLALTPDGNLTLVDDVGKTTGAGKQFVTMVTKNGNYFYLIIDRDDKGESTVHFLNQVDERDLFSLMDEDEAAAMKEELAAEEAARQAAENPPAATPSETEQEAQEPEPEKKGGSVIPALIVLLLVLGGGGAFFFLQLKNKKKEEAERPDPDADYDEDEDLDFGYPEDDGDGSRIGTDDNDYYDESDEDSAE